MKGFSCELRVNSEEFVSSRKRMSECEVVGSFLIRVRVREVFRGKREECVGSGEIVSERYQIFFCFLLIDPLGVDCEWN